MKKRLHQITVPLFALAGVLLVGWGLFLIYPPLAPIFVGVAMLVEVLTTRGQ